MVLFSSTHMCVGFRSGLYIHTTNIISIISWSWPPNQCQFTVKKWKPVYPSSYLYIKVHVFRKCFKALNPQVVSSGPLQFCNPKTQAQTNHVVWIVKLWLAC